MSLVDNTSQVCVFTSTLALNAVMVGNTLRENGIPATVIESNGPFAGSLFTPSEVLVSVEDEARARKLVEVDTTFHLQESEMDSGDQS